MRLSIIPESFINIPWQKAPPSRIKEGSQFIDDDEIASSLAAIGGNPDEPVIVQRRLYFVRPRPILLTILYQDDVALIGNISAGRGGNFKEQWADAANTIGYSTVINVLRSWLIDHPHINIIGGVRATGATPGKNVKWTRSALMRGA